MVVTTIHPEITISINHRDYCNGCDYYVHTWKGESMCALGIDAGEREPVIPRFQVILAPRPNRCKKNEEIWHEEEKKNDVSF